MEPVVNGSTSEIKSRESENNEVKSVDSSQTKDSKPSESCQDDSHITENTTSVQDDTTKSSNIADDKTTNNMKPAPVTISGSESLKHHYREMSVEELQRLLNDETTSKNQKKKIKKEIDWINTADQRKQERRKRKIEKKITRREHMKNLSNNQQDDVTNPWKKKRLNRVKTTDNFDDNIHIGVDCSFDDLMVNKDIRKLAHQISWCYKINRRCDLPVQYHLFGMTSRITSNLDPSYPNWDLHFDPILSESQISNDKIIYLTAESDNVLDDVKPGIMYVIGGLVDHNHHKGYCHELAMKRNYKTARLPLTENVDMKTRRVLTVNHVFEILQAQHELKDWKKSILKILPPKKIDGVKPEEQEES